MSGQARSPDTSMSGHARAVGMSKGSPAMTKTRSMQTRSIDRFKLHGVGVRAKRISQVEFVCPLCGVDRVGAVIEQQRWCHVVGVPVVPLATLDSAVRCDECGYCSGLSALEVLTASALTECLQLAMRYA